MLCFCSLTMQRAMGCAPTPSVILPAPPKDGESIIQAALSVLLAPTATLKAEHTDIAVNLWREGRLRLPEESDADAAQKVPDRPAREDSRVRTLHHRLEFYSWQKVSLQV
jgi:hypothetical protein